MARPPLAKRSSLVLRERSRVVSTRQRKLSKDEIRQAFDGADGARVGPILTLAELAEVIRVSPKTAYEWIAKGRLDGAFRKRGKHILIWRDRVLELLFNGPEWKK